MSDDDDGPDVDASSEQRVVRAYRAALGMGRRPDDAAVAAVCRLSLSHVIAVRRQLARFGLWPADLRGWPRDRRLPRLRPVGSATAPAPAPAETYPSPDEIAAMTAEIRGKRVDARVGSVGKQAEYCPRVVRSTPRGGIGRCERIGRG